MKKLLLLLVVFVGLYFSALPKAFAAAEGFYLGGQVGHVGLTDGLRRSYNNAIGFGLDLGIRTNPMLDIIFSSQYSSHAGGGTGLKILSETLSANLHFFQVND